MLGAADRAGWVHRQNLTSDKPIEEHADRCEVLLDGRRRVETAKLFDVRRHNYRFERVERESALLGPVQEHADVVRVRQARVLVADSRHEELDEATRRSVAGVGDDARQPVEAESGDLSLRYRGKLIVRMPRSQIPVDSGSAGRCRTSP